MTNLPKRSSLRSKKNLKWKMYLKKYPTELCILLNICSSLIFCAKWPINYFFNAFFATSLWLLSLFLLINYKK